MRRHVVQAERGVAQSPAGGVDDQVRADAVAADGEHALAVDLAAGAHAQLAQDAAVQIQPDVWVARVDRAIGIEGLEARIRHAERVGRVLQPAVAAALAARTEVPTLGEQHLHQPAPRAVERGVSVVHPLSRRGAGGAGGRQAAVHAHRAHTAGAAGPERGVPAQVRDVDAGACRRGDQRLAGAEGHALAVEFEVWARGRLDLAGIRRASPRCLVAPGSGVGCRRLQRMR